MLMFQLRNHPVRSRLWHRPQLVGWPVTVAPSCAVESATVPLAFLGGSQ
jgi:hypothetical protein